MTPNSMTTKTSTSLRRVSSSASEIYPRPWINASKGRSTNYATSSHWKQRWDNRLLMCSNPFEHISSLVQAKYIHQLTYEDGSCVLAGARAEQLIAKFSAQSHAMYGEIWPEGALNLKETVHKCWHSANVFFQCSCKGPDRSRHRWHWFPEKHHRGRFGERIWKAVCWVLGSNGVQAGHRCGAGANLMFFFKTIEELGGSRGGTDLRLPAVSSLKEWRCC